MTLGTLGAYRLERWLGAGTMADVFLARRLAGGAEGADAVVKRLRREHAENAEAVAMFRREAELLGRFAHPGIPRLHDFGHAEGAWYLAMEHVRGTSLAALRARGPTRVPLGIACAVVTRLCAILHHVHECAGEDGQPLGVVHRDVAPHNVALADDGRVTLLDFGVAAVARAPDPVPRGTHGYMAPEQIRGEVVDRRADVFSAGVLLYELSVGAPPFAGSALARLTAAAERDAEPPSARVPGYPPELEHIVFAAMRRARAERTATAAELAARIDAWCDGAGIVTHAAELGRWAGKGT